MRKITSPDLRAAFQDAFNRPATAAARAPDRLEILGNHTDYNEGVALSMAVDRAINGLVFADFRSGEARAVPLPEGVALVVADSLVKHPLAGEYNERRTRCGEAVAFLQVKHPEVRALRDVSVADLETAKPEMEVMAWRRARHVVGENARVFAGIEALKRGDLRAFGKLLDDSHESSRAYFENSCPELDILVACGQALPGHLGARLSGGGFGGITVHLVWEAEAAAYAERLATAFHSRTGTRPETMICHAAAGACRA